MDNSSRYKDDLLNRIPQINRKIYSMIGNENCTTVEVAKILDMQID